jgi:hypothetical protein
MKKLLFFSAAFFLLNALTSAQTLTSADFGSVGDQVTLGLDLTPGVSVGNSGAGQNWNFSSLNTETLDTLFFLDPSLLPNASSYPYANLAVSSNEGVFFFEKTAMAILNHGVTLASNAFATEVVFNPPLTYIGFPATLGSTATTVSSFEAASFLGIDTTILICQVTIDSFKIVRQSNYSVYFDATGTLTLPTQNFPNALRAYSQDLTRDSIFIYAPNNILCPPFLNVPQGWSLAPDFLLQSIDPTLTNVILDTTRIYTWYVPGEKFGVCAIDVNSAGAAISARFYSDASQIGLSIDNIKENDLTLYPNPTNGSVYVQSSESMDGHSIKVLDLNGKVVYTGAIQTGAPVQLQNLDSGLYIYEVYNEESARVSQGKVIVKK